MHECEWWVYVHDPDAGYIGIVKANTPESARAAALARYRAAGLRAQLKPRAGGAVRPASMFIFEDDTFEVRRG